MTKNDFQLSIAQLAFIRLLHMPHDMWASGHVEKAACVFIMYVLTLMLLVANLANTNCCKKTWKFTETLANGYSSESTQRELSNEYQHDSVLIVFFKDFDILVLWMKVADSIGRVNSAFPGYSFLHKLALEMPAR